MSTMAMGRIVPRGRQLGEAVAAGVVWLGAVAVMVAVPPAVRFAQLYRQRSHEGVGWAGVMLLLAVAGGLLVVAQALSRRAHGRRSAAPLPVRLVRWTTWAVYAGLFIGAWWIDSYFHGCFRTCAPFPQ